MGGETKRDVVRIRGAEVQNVMLRNRVAGLEKRLARAELMHERAAGHLRKERARRRLAEELVRGYRSYVEMWQGTETAQDVMSTPLHYRGDGFVTCRRAIDSCLSQEMLSEPPTKAVGWWQQAMQYLWRCWSKEDPVRDMRKSVSCIEVALSEVEADRG